jgi:tRNA pseudouridine55 synthase
MMFDFEKGETLLFDKPFDWSSFDVVKKIRYMIKKRVGKEIKVGHAGTLDPYATGLLILCTGKSTKQIESIQGASKTYTGIIQLGSTTPSYDLETDINQTFSVEHITEDLILKTAKQFIGEQMQLPPIFSAKMIDGKRAYEFARKGLDVEMKPNSISIYSFEARLIEDNQITFQIECSKGTYIRSIAHDLGKALNSGAHLTKLTRTGIGEYKLDNAFSIEKFQSILSL